MKYCSECGSENPDEASFCRNCGSGLKAAANEIAQKPAANTVKVNKNSSSVIENLFYKTDRYTGESRISKTNSISIAVFVFMFLFAIAFRSAAASVPVVIIVAIIFGLIFAVLAFVICTFLGLLADKIIH